MTTGNLNNRVIGWKADIEIEIEGRKLWRKKKELAVRNNNRGNKQRSRHNKKIKDNISKYSKRYEI